tara:strand:+ start:6437 stop:6703 length:267 start_codon:yes stop_codon:yes gene_type:complete
MDNSFNLTIYTPEEVLFDEKANYFSATNSTGEFGILPGHTLFSSDIVSGNIRVKSENGTEKKISHGPGVISMKSNQLIVALESGTLIE